jgi:rhodanese-like protein
MRRYSAFHLASKVVDYSQSFRSKRPEIFMRKAFISLFASTAAIALLAACNSAEHLITQAPSAQTKDAKSAPTAAPSDGARRIKAEELHELFQKGKVLVVDTRNEASFKQSHIKGAILIPAGEFASRSGELPRDKMIVTYCT